MHVIGRLYLSVVLLLVRVAQRMRYYAIRKVSSFQQYHRRFLLLRVYVDFLDSIGRSQPVTKEHFNWSRKNCDFVEKSRRMLLWIEPETLEHGGSLHLKPHKVEQPWASWREWQNSLLLTSCSRSISEQGGSVLPMQECDASSINMHQSCNVIDSFLLSDEPQSLCASFYTPYQKAICLL